MLQSFWLLMVVLLCRLHPDLNYRHRNAQMAGRASVELHTLIYFRKRYMTSSLFPLHQQVMCCRCLFWFYIFYSLQAHWCRGPNSEDTIQWFYCICAQVCFLVSSILLLFTCFLDFDSCLDIYLTSDLVLTFSFYKKMWNYHVIMIAWYMINPNTVCSNSSYLQILI